MGAGGEAKKVDGREMSTPELLMAMWTKGTKVERGRGEQIARS